MTLTVSQTLQLALQHQQAGRLAEAEKTCRDILAQNPTHAHALQLLGIIAGQAGRLDLAIEYTQRAIALNANEAFFHSNLAKYLIDAGRFEEARAAAQRAIAINPKNVDAFFNLALSEQASGQSQEAATAYRRAIELQPAFAKAYANLSNIYKEGGQIDQAIACLRQALAIAPDLTAAHSNLVYNLVLDPRQDARMIYDEHRLWNQHHAMPLARFIQPHANERTSTRRLRIGYVSPDFCEHVVGLNMLPLFRHHDHAQFEIFCYADVRRPDAVTEHFRGLADTWRQVDSLSDEQLAEQIRGDQIDILVDLTLHLTHNRLGLFARKPAPVQVTFAGYPGTTGLSTIDYRLTDPHLDPPGMFDDCYSEKSIRLPHSFWCYDPQASAAQVDVPSPLPSKTAGHITFGCLNNFCKVNPATLKLWARVLARVPGSRLLLLASDGTHRRRTVDQLESEGIAADRIEFTSYQPRHQYLKHYHRMDIGLDTLPYNGHTTTLDSLWMGVPVVTLIGHTVVGRAGLSQLMNLGLPELIAQTTDEFVNIAVALALDLTRLAGLRASLRSRMQRSELTNAKGFAQGIEAAFRHMWQIWCSSPDNGRFVPQAAIAGSHDSPRDDRSTIPRGDISESWEQIPDALRLVQSFQSALRQMWQHVYSSPDNGFFTRAQ